MTHRPGISEYRLAEAMAVAGVGCWEWQPDTDAVLCSSNFCSLVGIDSDALPADRLGWLEFFHREDRPALAKALISVASPAGHPFHLTLRLKDAFGNWRWFAIGGRHCADAESPRVLVTFRDITEQHQTDAALRDSQLRYRALYGNSPLAFILWDRNGAILEWNRRAETTFGWQAEAVIGKRIHQLLLPTAEQDRFREAVQGTAKNQSDGRFVGHTLTREGAMLWCDWTNVPLRSRSGNLIGVMSLVMDATAQAQAQERLQNSEKTYRALIETSPDAIFLLDLRGNILLTNQRARTLFALDELEDMESLCLGELLPDTGRPAILNELLANPDDLAGLVFQREWQLLRKNQELFDAEVSFTAIMESGETANSLVLFIRDISARKATAAELEHHQHNLQQLVQERTRELEDAHEALSGIVSGIPVPTFVINSDNVVTHWNAACEKLFGYPAGAMIGTRDHWKPFYDEPRPLMADLVMAGNLDIVRSLYGTKHYRPSEVVEGAFQAEDFFPGINRWLYFTAAPLHNGEGEKIGAIETLQDISEQKHAEDALREAKGLAEAAANTKAEFLANMSHEIRTPMNAVIGLANLLLNTELNPRQEEYAKRIHGAGRMLLGLINDILDFSKIEAGRMTLEHAPFALDDVLDNLATVVLDRAQEKKLELLYIVEPDVPQQLVGDSLRLSQILINLVGNAIKFTASGSIMVFVRASDQTAEKICLEISVQDSGIGMTQEQQSKLFQAFSQADTSTTRKYGGTGLGLSICKRLVEMMGGEIWVTSQAGVGSTFSLTLRLDKGESSAVVPASASHAINALVVDDNPMAAKILARLLEKNGCQVTMAGNGEAALEQLRQASPPFDYVAIDYNMPGMDGLTLAHIIRQEIAIQPRLVMVTAADTHSLEKSADFGEFDTVLNKPVTAAQISKLVAGFVDPEPRRAVRQTVAAASLAGLRVLLVEDIPTNQIIAAELLSSFGATVDTAENGRIGVEKVETALRAYHVVLMDLQMPEMDGLTATRHLRSDPRWEKLPIVAMTAHALDEERNRCREAGMNGFITKPIDPDILCRTLAPWVPGNPEQSASNTQPAAPPPQTPKPTAGGVPELPGIDIQEGLRRMMNKPALYRKILVDFRSRFLDEPRLIREALAAGDQEGARRRAHSVKGLAGSIGAAKLQEAAKTLEQAIAEQNPATENHLQAFDAALSLVLEGIASGLGST